MGSHGIGTWSRARADRVTCWVHLESPTDLGERHEREKQTKEWSEQQSSVGKTREVWGIQRNRNLEV